MKVLSSSPRLIQVGVLAPVLFAAFILSALFISFATSAHAESPDPFDGQTLEVKHVTADSTACLDVKYGNATNGQDVWTWECNKTDAQMWKFEKRTAGDYADSYRLVSTIGNDTHCLDNRGDFVTSTRMGVWSCVSDTDGAVANQTVTIAASGDGYTLTFVRNSDSKSVWLSTYRVSQNPKGGAGQTPVTDTVPASAIWQIGENTSPSPTPEPTAEPTAVATPELVSLVLQSDDPPPPQAQNAENVDTDPYDGKTFFLRHPSGSSVDCLEVPSSTVTTRLEVGTCDYSDNQEWVFQKRTSGEWAGSYRMAHKPSIGTNRVLCAIMSADYGEIDTNVKLGRCRGDNDGRADYQTFTVENVPGGYAIRFATDHPYVYFYYTRLGVTKDDDNNDDVATIPAGNARNETVAPTAAVTWELLEEAPDFDDQIVQIYHVDDTSTACLSAVKRSYQGWTVVNEKLVEVAECSDDAFQQWRLEKMSSGAYLIRTMASGQHRCIDNHSHYETNSDLKAGRCAVNSNYKPSVNTDKWHWYNPVEDQSVTITAAGDGYTLTFDNGTKSSWITTGRTAGVTSGSVGQTTVVNTVADSAVWGIGTVDDRIAGRTNPSFVTPLDPYNGKTFRIKHRHEAGGTGGWISSCVHPGSGFPPKFTPGNYLMLAGAYGACHDNNESAYDSYSAMASWKVEKRSSGDFAGYYRFVHQHGNKDLCLDADVADTIDGGLEFTTTPTTARSGIYIDTCVGDDHADVASQSVKITRHNDGDGAWGKDSYTLSFVEDTSDDAREVWLSMTTTYGDDVGQRVVTDDVPSDAVFYMEEQVHAIPDRP